MSVYTIVAIIVVAAAVVGFILTKIGEYAGIGTESASQGIRGDHGPLVRTRRLDDTYEATFRERFPRVVAFVGIPTLIILILCVIGVFSFGGMLAGSLDIIIVIIMAVGVAQGDAGMGRSFAYALGGYIAGGLASALVGLVLLPLVMNADAGLVNLLTMVLGTIGTILAISWMPFQRTYAREFADGHVNSLKVSSHSGVCKIYDKLEDKNWKPPADRVQNPEIADNIRALKEGDVRER